MVSSIPPSTKEEKKPMLSYLQPSYTQDLGRNKKNRGARECQWRCYAKAHEIDSQSVFSLSSQMLIWSYFSNLCLILRRSFILIILIKDWNCLFKLIFLLHLLCAWDLSLWLIWMMTLIIMLSANDYDDMYEVVEINHELSSRISKTLTLAPSDTHSDSSLEDGPYLILGISTCIILIVASLASCLPSLNDVDQPGKQMIF